MRHQHSSEKRRFVRSVQRLRTLNIGTENVSFRKGLGGRGGRLGEGAGRAEHLHQEVLGKVTGKSPLKRSGTSAFSFLFLAFSLGK